VSVFPEAIASPALAVTTGPVKLKVCNTKSVNRPGDKEATRSAADGLSE
jgi:hypothetical protein